MNDAAAPPNALRGQFAQVLLATLASTFGFWAWMLISPIQGFYADKMHLNEVQISLMIATPVLVGAIGRIVTGALTDRFGGRRMFTWVLLATVPAVLLVALAGSIGSFPLLIVAGTCLGIGGTIFAVGIPFSSAWYTASRRGFAAGIFGMGMIGTAVSAFFTPRLLVAIGYWPTHLLLAAILVVMAVLVWLRMKESPQWKPSRQPFIPKILGALKLPITWEMSFLYAIVFGGFVAFSTFLPKYLVTIYPTEVDAVGAGTRTALFAVSAVIARPIGGMLADRFGPKVISLLSLAGIVGLAYIVGQQPPEGIVTGVTFLGMAAAMGLGMGAVYAWIGPSTPKDKVGAVSGVVAAAGGLGGYLPPLVMGATYNAQTNSYALGLWLLVLVGAFALVVAGMLNNSRTPDRKDSIMSEERFPASVYERRVAQARELAAAAGFDALVVTPGPDLQYLLGSRAQTLERLTALVLPADADAFLVVPTMELAALRSSALADLDIDVRRWVDGDDPYALALDIGGAGGGGDALRVGFSEATPALHVVPLAAAAGTPPELATGVLRRLRMRKDDAEIEALRQAADAIDRVHARVPEWLRPGRTEREVAADIAAAIVEEGHARADFVIVGSGPNGADPHHEVSDRVIAANETVVVDIGGPVPLGYNSDSTRTYATGDVPDDVQHAFDALELAQRTAVDAVRPDATAESVDAAARDVLVAARLGDKFLHRTGHGIGLSVHEEPYIVGGSALVLEPGMAFSIEPGVYFAGAWGARIEDIVLVTDDGVDDLNHRPHSLTRV